jgi:hypothetical protein
MATTHTDIGLIPATPGTKIRCKHMAYSNAAKKIVTCGRPAKWLDTRNRLFPACGIHANQLVAAAITLPKDGS